MRAKSNVHFRLYVAHYKSCSIWSAPVYQQVHNTETSQTIEYPSYTPMNIDVIFKKSFCNNYNPSWETNTTVSREKKDRKKPKLLEKMKTKKKDEAKNKKVN